MKKVKKSEYRKICRDGVHDRNLSLKAKGLLWYLLDKPYDWKNQVYEISHSNEKDGSQSIRTAIKELKEAGYIKLVTPPKVNGRFVGKYYEVYGRFKDDENFTPKTYIKASKEMSWEDQYNTREWSIKRNKIFKRDNYTCSICGEINTVLNVHHKKYLKDKFVWESPDEDLITLCNKCHKKEHKK